MIIDAMLISPPSALSPAIVFKNSPGPLVLCEVSGVGAELRNASAVNIASSSEFPTNNVGQSMGAFPFRPSAAAPMPAPTIPTQSHLWWVCNVGQDSPTASHAATPASQRSSDRPHAAATARHRFASNAPTTRRCLGIIVPGPLSPAPVEAR